MSYRRIYLTGFVLAAAALGVSVFFMELYLGLEPCPLCVLSRIVVVLIAVLFLLIALHNPGILGQRIYALVAVLLVLLGIAISARHIWLQSLPAGEVPGCTPDLGYLVNHFSLSEVFDTLFNSSGECADISWTFLGLTIPEQTLFLFIIILIMPIIALAKTFRVLK